MFKRIGVLFVVLVLPFGGFGCSDTKASEATRPEVPKVQETITMGQEKVEVTIEEEDAPADSEDVVVVPPQK